MAEASTETMIFGSIAYIFCECSLNKTAYNRADMLTEHEAWCAILDVLEGYGMPPFCKKRICIGLCSVVSVMERDRVISLYTLRHMQARIKNALRGTVGFGPWFDVPSRIPYVRRFIEETKRRETRS